MYGLHDSHGNRRQTLTDRPGSRRGGYAPSLKDKEIYVRTTLYNEIVAMAPQEEPQGNNCSDRVNSIFKTLYRLLFSGGITLEPGIFCILVGTFFVSGPEISTNLLLWKICHIKFGYNETVCDNLSADENNDIENEVQIAANNFKLSETFVIAAPGFIAAIFAGALSDRYGRKKLMIVPMFGHFLAAIFGLINYAFIEVLPLQFFYLEQTFHFFGGQSLYYMGLYSYGADITPEKERVVRFCRWDATELIGVIVGSALSPLLYKWAGPYASYSGFILLQGTAILYFYFFIKEKPRNSDEEEKQTVSQESCMQKFRGIWEIYVKQPILDFIVTLKKKRDGQKSTMIRVLLVIYAFYYLILANYGQLYLYMIKAFPGFNGESYAYYTMYSFTIGIVGLLIYVPLTKRALKWHESAIACFSTTCMAVGLIVAAFVKTAFPGFYLARLIIGFENCIFSTARSMMTRCVDGNEVGKMFAIIAISAPLARVIMDPITKSLYNATLDTFPSAWLLLESALTFVTLALNFYLFLKRDQITSIKITEEQANNNTELKGKGVEQ